LRARQQPTLPSTILLERQINPFLRSRQAALIQAAQGFDTSARDEVSIFAALREWKNQFQ
jgi:hydroxyacylglutathione hydrolase